jgi:hypothetical protein
MPTTSAKIGERMLTVTVRFWTNNIARGKGRIKPRNAWTSGTVRIEPNEPHGIRSRQDVKFHSLLTLPAAIEKVLIQNGITLHPATDAKYLPARKRKRRG